MLDQKKPEVKKFNKSHGNIWLLYPRELSPKVGPAPIISFLQYDETFHTNMRVYLTISQVFALIPLSGISGPTAASLRYSFCSLRSIYARFILTLTLCHGGLILYFNYKTGFTFDKIFPLIWFTVNPFVMYQFIRIAQKWPKLMHHWETFELTTSHRDPRIHKQMRRIIISTSILIPMFAAVEHLFSLGNNINTARKCKKATNTLTAYFKGAFPAYFHFFEVNYFNGICVQVLNLYSTFTWSMSDSFIVLISLGLITQFRHFNEHFEKFRGMNLPPEFWGRQRLTFTKLTELLDHVNNDLAVLILTSFSVNTFYICVQLYESVSPDGESVIRRIYFWYSLIYLIGKTFMVSIVATFINDEAKKPIKVLESVPGSVYGSEASRFMTQLTTGTIALGGMDFFYLTRAFLISMAGTIVTYEIILIQLKTQPAVDMILVRDKSKHYDEFKSKVSPQLDAPSHSYEGTFHRNIKLCQVFALMPINGISGLQAVSLKFSFCTFRMLYTVVIMTASIIVGITTFYWTILRELKFDNIVSIIWFVVNPIAMGQNIYVCYKWPALMMYWEAVELDYTIRDEKTHLMFRRLILIATIGVSVMAGVEHFLSLANNVNSTLSCNNQTTADRVNIYFRHAFPAFSEFFGMNYFSGICMQVLNLICTFTWNFTDNFVLIVSLGLITQFRHFNIQFDKYKGMCLPDDFWGKQRTYYNKLVNLIDYVNKDLAGIILISYTNNLFYICLQLFHSVTPSHSLIRSIYFWYSLIYLIGRMVVVSMTAALINDEAKKPIAVLQLVPATVYRSESKRFMDQLSSNTVALSGMQFFHITKKFMLSITGTIITYELVLIQLQRDPIVEEDICIG
ncbi:LOW QUALITY PROTEIN: uncharacterized protein LOC129944290 [Eupeodes corollae]|uniref:LOW QUALITY PROTEIN: uncharacterized protein LOC129944290 n=1 Tax=Eupeodes corollae TaxID=290404 RepID=UPI00248F5572|nr:LOW QUALITY PROTEIN: uncharacterized protein LOC129944290 [Eupeodes corollae]